MIAVVSEALANRYTHAEINQFMEAAGIEMAIPPEGNRQVKTRAWLNHVNESMPDPLGTLAQVITELMEVRPGHEWETAGDPNKEKVDRILGRYKLTYVTGGHIVTTGATTVSKTVQDIIKARDLSGLQTEFDRIYQTVESDPAATVTASCALLESLFKTYIEEERLEMPSDQSLKPLWKVVRKSLGFDPALVEDEDLKTILSGLAAVVEGTGSLRTHKGSAHGRTKKSYMVKPRHARLAAHAAFTLAGFVLESWEHKIQSKGT